MPGRGVLTDRIKKKSKELFGYEIDTVELRLMVYVQYVMINEQHIDIRKVNEDERAIISKWREKEFMTGGASQINMSKVFWDGICEIVWLGYVDIEN